MEQQRHLSPKEGHTGSGLFPTYPTGKKKKSDPSRILSLSRTRKAKNLTGCHPGATRILTRALITNVGYEVRGETAPGEFITESRAQRGRRGQLLRGTLTLTPRLYESGSSKVWHAALTPGGEEERSSGQFCI